MQLCGVTGSCVILLSLPLRDCQHTAVSWTQKTQQLVWQEACNYQGEPGSRCRSLSPEPETGSDI